MLPEFQNPIQFKPCKIHSEHLIDMMEGARANQNEAPRKMPPQTRAKRIGLVVWPANARMPTKPTAPADGDRADKQGLDRPPFRYHPSAMAKCLRRKSARSAGPIAC